MKDILPKQLVDKAREVIEANRKAGRRIAVAESCTGGLVSAAITEVPGASDVFFGGIVSYSDEAKINRLKVGSDVIETFGAVSIATAWAMARGTLEASGADVAVAITGIAGPDGGTPTKPVGTVFIGVAVAGTVEARQFRFPGGRASVKWQSSQMALDMLRRRLGGQEPR